MKREHGIAITNLENEIMQLKQDLDYEQQRAERFERENTKIKTASGNDRVKELESEIETLRYENTQLKKDAGMSTEVKVDDKNFKTEMSKDQQISMQREMK